MLGKIQFINKIDDRGRFTGLEAHLGSIESQSDSHGISYMGARRCYQEMYGQMGLECDRYYQMKYRGKIDGKKQ